MALTSDQMKAKIDTFAGDMTKLNSIVNGTNTQTTSTDGGTVPSVAKAIKDSIQDPGQAAVNTFNTNGNNAITAFNSDADDALTAFGTDSTTALNTFGTNSTNALDTFDTNSSSALTAFGTDATTALNDFQTAGDNKITDIQNQADAAIADVTTQQVLATNAAVSATAKASEAFTSAANAAASALSAQSSARTCATWSVLATLTPTSIGQGAEVLDTDTGTHTDPSTSATVNNAGRFTAYATTVGAWTRIGDTGLASKVNLTQIGNLSAASIPAESGWTFGIEDSSHKLALGIDTSGKVWTRLTDDSTVPESALPPATLAKFLQGGLTSGSIIDESGFRFALEDSSHNVGFGLKADGTFWAKLADDVILPSSFTTSAISVLISQLLGSTSITCWGDSLTQGAGGSGTTYPYIMSVALSRTAYNMGIGGQDTLSIAIRSGSVPLTVTLTGNQIPASGGVAITSKNANILYSGGTYTGTVHVSIGGVPGLITTDSSGNWTFTRDSAGSIVNVSANVQATIDAGTSFIPDPSLRRADISVIWAGRNGDKTTRTAIVATRNYILSMIKYLTPLSKRVLVLSVLNGTGETTGTTAYNQINDLNKELAASLGDRFIDVRRYLIDNGLSDAGLTPTTQDTTDIAGDTVPAQLRVDTIHLTATGYTLVGNFVARHMQARGW